MTQLTPYKEYLSVIVTQLEVFYNSAVTDPRGGVKSKMQKNLGKILKLNLCVCLFFSTHPPTLGVFPNFFRIEIMTPPLRQFFCLKLSYFLKEGEGAISNLSNFKKKNVVILFGNEVSQIEMKNLKILSLFNYYNSINNRSKT